MILKNTCNYTKTSNDANHQHDLFISRGIIQITLNILPLIEALDTQYIWVNYNDLTATSLEIIVRKGNHPKMALIQVG